jgi:hypothetical protein
MFLKVAFESSLKRSAKHVRSRCLRQCLWTFGTDIVGSNILFSLRSQRYYMARRKARLPFATWCSLEWVRAGY